MTPATPLPIWPTGTPGAFGSGPQDIPTLTTYRPEPERANGATLLVLPGGGYSCHASHEGEGFATWFAAQGVTCHVLAYRLGSAGYRHPCMIDDAARGLRLARAYARREGLDPSRVGIIGSSAGGHLAATLLTRHTSGKPDAEDPAERESSRPDLGILCYPVISGVSFPHQGSFQNLLGPAPSADMLRALSADLNVTADTPPTFIWHTANDQAVPVENAMLFASALRRAGVPFDLHIYENGRHGLGLPADNDDAPPWDQDCLFWLRQRGFIPTA